MWEKALNKRSEDKIDWRWDYTGSVIDELPQVITLMENVQIVYAESPIMERQSDEDNLRLQE